MPNSEKLISRHDLIAAGASFFIHRYTCEHDPDLLALPLCYQRCNETITYGEIEGVSLGIMVHPGCNFAKIFVPDRRVPAVCFKSSSYEQMRTRLAAFVRPADREACDALRMPWDTSGYPYWPDPAWALRNGLNIDALAYSAVQKQDTRVSQMYFEAGANPLARTFDGDCTARLGVSNGMLDLFGSIEHLDARAEDSGETGLFDRARQVDIDTLLHAYRLGADPEIRNHLGQSVLDLVLPSFWDEVCAAIAHAQAKTLRDSSLQPSGGAGAACTRLRL